MEAYCFITAKGLRFHAPSISHSIAVMVLALGFHSEDPNGVGDAVNVFIFTGLSSVSGLEVGLLTRW